MPPQCIPSRQARITAGEFILQPVIQWAESPPFLQAFSLYYIWGQHCNPV